MVDLETIENKNLQFLWQDCINSMESVVDKITFETIIKNTHPVVKNSNTLELYLQKTWQKDHLKKFMEPIRDIICKKFNSKIDLDFVIKSNGYKEKSPSDLHADENILKIKDTGNKYGGNGKTDDIQYVVSSRTAGSKDDQSGTFLDPRYTFDNYVVGSNNHFAAAAAQAVAETPASAYNPLFIYGGVGLGKTHLIQAIGHKVLDRNPKARIVYVSAEKFMNDMIESIQNKKMMEFRRKYRNVNILLIDDIQFIKNKESTQEEFFHTFNELHGAKSQIILTSDRPPKDIQALEDRLRSRFEGGLIADISAPDLETRIAIINKKAEMEHLDVPPEVTTYIAEMIPSNIRELEGALNRVICYSSLMKKTIDMDTAVTALKSILPDATPKYITIRFIQEKVCEYYNIKIEEMLGKCRDSRLVVPRQVAMFLSKDFLGSSFPNIGKSFGGRDHTTVMHAFRKISKKAKNSPMKNDIDNIKNLLKNNGG